MTELDGATTAQASEGSQHRMELDATASETRPPVSPKAVAELPGADRR